MKTTIDPLVLKARLLCEGANVNQEVLSLFLRQNPSGIKRGGLSSGGKIKLETGFFVNFPLYLRQQVPFSIIKDPEKDNGIFIVEEKKVVSAAEIIEPPSWYAKTVQGFEITKIFTAHNRQLAAAVFEDCVLFHLNQQCRFCVINRSLKQKNPKLILKSEILLVEALNKIPRESYDGITLNGGMTLTLGRGMEILIPVVRLLRQTQADISIAVEITPPVDLIFIKELREAGASSLMMNLETWDEEQRQKIIPGKNKYCPRSQYLKAFEYALKIFGPGRVSTCFVVGTESLESLKQGIEEVINLGVIPSPLAGRFFEDIIGYPFCPKVNWQEFMEVLKFTTLKLREKKIQNTDKAGCIACGMCDVIKDFLYLYQKI
ncbi:MAG: radical SAM protein [Candidatus Pacebacteria bacterium]|nr:radical SAM protein [Candidatus Paceibacterota bacterium]